MIALYLLGLLMELIASKFVYHLTAKQAPDWVCDRLRLLKLHTEIPEDWQRSYHKCPESTTTESYTLEEDIELCNGAQIEDWLSTLKYLSKETAVRLACAVVRTGLCGLPGLLDKAVRIKDEIWGEQKEAETHFARHRLCLIATSKRRHGTAL
jgi:hypothetical protein